MGFATLGVAAMSYPFASIDDRPEFSAGNFFSFFTIQSNILAAGMLFVVAIVRGGERTALFDAVRGAVTLYIAITGVVFALLLSGLQEELDTHIGWVNFVVHTLIPIVAVVDWLIEPARHRLPLWVAGAWLSYPAAWFVYTLIRVGRLVPVSVRGCRSARLRTRASQCRRVARHVRRRCAGLRARRQPPQQGEMRPEHAEKGVLR